MTTPPSVPLHSALSQALLVECWTYSETLELDVPGLLRALADDLDNTGASLLAVIVSAEEPYIQALVDTERGTADSGASSEEGSHG